MLNLKFLFNVFLFQDMGTFFDDKLSSSNFSQATGAGLRFNTAVGTIRFDVGFKCKVRNEFESRYAWSLAFDNAF